MYQVLPIREWSLPLVSMACFAAAGIAARKGLLGAGCKVGAIAAEALGRNDAAEWNKKGDDYLALAKNDAIYDLTAVAGFLALGLVEAHAANIVPVPPPVDEDFISSGQMLLASLITAGLSVPGKCFVLRDQAIIALLKNSAGLAMAVSHQIETIDRMKLISLSLRILRCLI